MIDSVFCSLAYLLLFYILLWMIRGPIQLMNGHKSGENAEIKHVLLSVKNQYYALDGLFLKHLEVRKETGDSTEDACKRDLEMISDDLLILFHQLDQFMAANYEKISPVYFKLVSSYTYSLQKYLLLWEQHPKESLDPEEQKLKHLRQSIYQLWT
jgi:hypothetical protein